MPNSLQSASKICTLFWWFTEVHKFCNSLIWQKNHGLQVGSILLSYEPWVHSWHACIGRVKSNNRDLPILYFGHLYIPPSWGNSWILVPVSFTLLYITAWQSTMVIRGSAGPWYTVSWNWNFIREMWWIVMIPWSVQWDLFKVTATWGGRAGPMMQGSVMDVVFSTYLTLPLCIA